MERWHSLGGVSGGGNGRGGREGVKKRGIQPDREQSERWARAEAWRKGRGWGWGVEGVGGGSTSLADVIAMSVIWPADRCNNGCVVWTR